VAKRTRRILREKTAAMAVVSSWSGE
jgi:hypothetical protein